MGSFDWSDRFVTGLGTVDEQHRHLVGLIDRYGDLLAQNALEAADPSALLAQLHDYAGYHFREEEALMAARALDPRHTAAHRREHARFLTDVGGIAARVTAGEASAARSLLDFLVHWLAYHILVQDQNMARQLAALTAGLSAAEAYEASEREADGATEPLVVALTGLFQQVSAQNQALLDLNRSLEARVEERTRALSEANLRLEEIAMTDVLTGLPNRRHGMSRLGQLWLESSATGRPLSCLMIDADGFKRINDVHGHDAGDAVLRALARELLHGVRTDDVVCRLGGDEFLVICPGTDGDGARRVAEHLRAAVAALSVTAGGGTWRGSISVGIGTRAGAMSGHEELVKAADLGVYAAKQSGKNCVRAAGD